MRVLVLANLAGNALARAFADFDGLVIASDHGLSCRMTSDLRPRRDGLARDLCALLRRVLRLEQALAERPRRREQHGADEARANHDDAARHAEEFPHEEYDTAAEQAAARRQILRQDLRARRDHEMMVRRERERIERRDAEEAQRIMDAVMLRHVLPADEQDQQHDNERTDAEHVVQKPREIDADEPDIEPCKTAGRNDTGRENGQAEQFIATVRIRGRRRFAVPLPRCSRCFFGNCLSCQSITYLILLSARHISALRT